MYFKDNNLANNVNNANFTNNKTAINKDNKIIDTEEKKLINLEMNESSIINTNNTDNQIESSIDRKVLLFLFIFIFIIIRKR